MSFINKIGKIFGTSSSAPAASRSVAKERLSVILAAQRGTHLLEGVDMEALQRDVMEVVQVRKNVSLCIYSKMRWCPLQRGSPLPSPAVG